MFRSFFSALASFFGWSVIITVPLVFFVFGWKDIEVRCDRSAVGELPTCMVSESFAMRLYTRHFVIERAIRIGQHTNTVRQSSARTGMVTTYTSTLAFDTAEGEVLIGHANGPSTERELILTTRAFLDDPSALNFRYEAKLHTMMGYLGLVGVAGLLFILLVLLSYLFARLTTVRPSCNGQNSRR